MKKKQHEYNTRSKSWTIFTFDFYTSNDDKLPIYICTYIISLALTVIYISEKERENLLKTKHGKGRKRETEMLYRFTNAREFFFHIEWLKARIIY